MKNKVQKITGNNANTVLPTDAVKDKSTSINDVGKICKAILKLTDYDFACVEEMAKEQMEYFHPLKNGTAQKLNKTGENNTKIIMALRKLKVLIENGK